MKSTAFVSHFDCSRHDTGWGHPDHQGRLPALMRAVHADMLTLFDHLLEVEGRRASEDELLLVHSPDYLRELRGWVADAGSRGEVIEPRPGIRVSPASWDAAAAAVGCVLTAVEAVLAGEARSAFCAVRPPGRYVMRDAPAESGLLNTVATAAGHAAGLGTRVAVLELGGPGRSINSILAGIPEESVAGVYVGTRGEPTSWSGPELLAALEDALAQLSLTKPELLLLSLGFDLLDAPHRASGGVTPLDYYHLTMKVRQLAQECCGGRIVSILEGGQDVRMLGSATVQHLRGLVGEVPA